MTQQQDKKLYVGSLPYSTSEDELKELFGQYGSVASARIISDKFTGQSKGFGFVEMNSADEAQKAIDGVNGTQLGGRTLVVNIARPPAEGGGGGGGGGGRGNREGGDRGGRDRRGGGGGGWGGGERRDRSFR